ncbi:hypothetical protein GQ54DRAFT_296254 [Martensiomyces pterosporus]|nr:hypothetical protein GQ54DRAFT_296254 [Martensiomyces pterosporus]
MTSPTSRLAKLFKRKSNDSLKDFDATNFKNSTDYADTYSVSDSLATVTADKPKVLDASKGGSANDALSYLYSNNSSLQTSAFPANLPRQ